MLRRLGSLVGALAIFVALALAGVMLVPAALGYERYVITTGSMTGTYDPGAMIFDRVVPVDDLRVGDVITYDPPAEAELPGVVTHRIAELRAATSEDLGVKPGQPVIRTKGDANERPDDWTFTPSGASLPKVVAGVPHLGSVYARLDSRPGRIAVFALPGLLIAFSVLGGLWREAGEAARREADGEDAAGGADPVPGEAVEGLPPRTATDGAVAGPPSPAAAPVPLAGTAVAVGAVPVGPLEVRA